MERCELQSLVSPLPEMTRSLSDPEAQQKDSPGSLTPILSPRQEAQLPEKQLKIESKQLSRVPERGPVGWGRDQGTLGIRNLSLVNRMTGRERTGVT